MDKRNFTPSRVRRKLRDLEKKEIVPYRELMTGYNKGLLMWAQVFLKEYNYVQRRIQRIKTNAKELSKKFERESKEGRIRQRLYQLEQQSGISYRDLMSENRGMFKWATRYMAYDSNVQESIKRERKRAKAVFFEAKRDARKEEVRRELLELEQQESVSYELLMAEKREFLKWAIKNLNDNESQERIARTKKRAKAVSLKFRIGIKQDMLRKELSELEQQQEISYEELMDDKNKNLVIQAELFLKDDVKVQERIKKLKREGLKVSIKRVAANGSLYNSQVSSEFPYLEKASREVYEKNDGKIALQMLAEDAGIVYFQKYKHRNLKQLLEDINAFERGDDDKSHGRKQGIRKVILRRFGHHGKGLIIAGFDYLGRRIGGIQKQDYVFSQEELGLIASDTSLSDEEKARCLFNALSLQYYEFLNGCMVAKELNRAYYLDADERQNYLNGRLEIAIAKEVFDDVDCAVGIYCSGNSKFIGTNFEFSGENGESAGRVFYQGLENRLRFLNGDF